MTQPPFWDRFRHRRAADIYLGSKEEGGELYIPRSALDTHAHFLGPTGTGKTRALRLVAEQLIAFEDCAVVVLDPHDGTPPYGGLYHGLKAYCYENDYADRLITVDPGDVHHHGMVAGFNPLARGHSPVVQAGLAVEHLKAVIGGNQAFIASPMLARWSYNMYLGLIVCGLPIADSLRVLDLNDHSYREVFAEVLRDRYADVASDWSWLIERAQRSRTRELLDDKLGSTTNRMRQYANNETLRYMLSTTGRTLDPAEVLRSRMVVLANLNPRGFIREADQRMLGVQLLHSFCRAAMDRTDHESAPCYVVVDEFANFVTPEVLEILDGGRKFGLHLILAHQYLQQLQDVAAQDWRYYHAVMSNARLRVVFGGLSPTDSESMGNHLYGAHLDPDRIKQEIWGTVQTSHQEWVDLVTQTRATSHSSSSSSSDTSGRSDHTSHVTSGPFLGMALSSSTFSDGYGSALSAATAEMEGDSHTEMEGQSSARVPITVPDDPELELRSREFMSLEEQLYRHASAMRRMDQREAVLQVRGDYPIRFRVADVPDPLLTFSEVHGPDRERLAQASWASPVAQIEEETRARDLAVRAKLSLREPRHEEGPLDAGAAIARLRKTSAKRTGRA